MPEFEPLPDFPDGRVHIGERYDDLNGVRALLRENSQSITPLYHHNKYDGFPPIDLPHLTDYSVDLTEWLVAVHSPTNPPRLSDPLRIQRAIQVSTTNALDRLHKNQIIGYQYNVLPCEPLDFSDPIMTTVVVTDMLAIAGLLNVFGRPAPSFNPSTKVVIHSPAMVREYMERAQHAGIPVSEFRNRAALLAMHHDLAALQTAVN